MNCISDPSGISERDREKEKADIFCRKENLIYLCNG